MAKFKCRICLDSNVRMHRISGSEVEDVYERLTKIKIKDDGELYFACYICYCQLKNSQQLVIKSQKSEELLNQISVNTPQMNMQVTPVSRLLWGLQNSLIMSDIVSLQIPEYNKNIKMENQAESDTNETWNTSEPDDERPSPNEMSELDEKYNLIEFKDDFVDIDRTENFSGIEMKTVPNINKSYQHDGKTFVCNDCGKTCNSKALLITHIRRHHPVTIKPNEIYTNINKSESHGNIRVNDNLKKEFKCQYCNYIAVQRNTLNEHIGTHTGEKPFKCQYCSYICIQISTLKNHIRTHTRKKPFQCQYCSYTCKHNSVLKNHIRTHTGEKPLKCQYCSYTCACHSDLKNHIRTHTRKKPFKCQYCSYTCAHICNLKDHIRSHTGEKPFNCEHCTYTCTRTSDLKNHIRTHTGERPFQCQYCSYTCAQNSHLKRHIQTHTGEKPFKCQYCSYTCTVNSSLKQHIRIHTGEKYTCEICAKQFKTMYSLKKHLQVHMDNKSF